MLRWGNNFITGTMNRADYSGKTSIAYKPFLMVIFSPVVEDRLMNFEVKASETWCTLLNTPDLWKPRVFPTVFFFTCGKVPLSNFNLIYSGQGMTFQGGAA